MKTYLLLIQEVMGIPLVATELHEATASLEMPVVESRPRETLCDAARRYIGADADTGETEADAETDAEAEACRPRVHVSHVVPVADGRAGAAWSARLATLVLTPPSRASLPWPAQARGGGTEDCRLVWCTPGELWGSAAAPFNLALFVQTPPSVAGKPERDRTGYFGSGPGRTLRLLPDPRPAHPTGVFTAYHGTGLAAWAALLQRSPLRASRSGMLGPYRYLGDVGKALRFAMYPTYYHGAGSAEDAARKAAGGGIVRYLADARGRRTFVVPTTGFSKPCRCSRCHEAARRKGGRAEDADDMRRFVDHHGDWRQTTGASVVVLPPTRWTMAGKTGAPRKGGTRRVEIAMADDVRLVALDGMRADERLRTARYDPEAMYGVEPRSLTAATGRHR